MTFTARPPAKLNLNLEVGPRAKDGFHPLRSIFLRIGLSDRLKVRQSTADAGRDVLTLSGLDGVPVEGNLVLHAVQLLRRRSGLPLPALAIELDKQIPVAAGLAGGSSDAAAMLELAAACWGVGLSDGERLALAARLGSDVPFFSSGATAALVEGRGERVAPLGGVIGRPGVLLVTPAIAVPTAAAFAAFDELGGPSAAGERLTDELAAALRAGLAADELPAWATRLREANDLWPAAVRLAPALDTLRAGLESATGRAWLLSGSGSSLFALYASPDEATQAGAALASGEAPGLVGARLIATDLEGPDPRWRQQA